MPKFKDLKFDKESPKAYLKALSSLKLTEIEEQFDDIESRLWDIDDPQDRLNIINKIASTIEPEGKMIKKFDEWFENNFEVWQEGLISDIIDTIDGDSKKIPNEIKKLISKVKQIKTDYGKKQIDFLEDDLTDIIEDLIEPDEVEITPLTIEDRQLYKLLNKKRETGLSAEEKKERNILKMKIRYELLKTKEQNEDVVGSETLTPLEREELVNLEVRLVSNEKLKKEEAKLTEKSEAKLKKEEAKLTEKSEAKLKEKEDNLKEKEEKLKEKEDKLKKKEDKLGKKKPIEQLPPPVVDIPMDKSGIPNALKSIRTAKSVEDWLAEASICRVVLDKEDFSNESFLKILFDKFEKYKYECGFKLIVKEDNVELVAGDRKRTSVTPEELNSAIKSCDEFICYVSVIQGTGRHANLLVLRNKVLYRFDPHGEKGSSLQDEFLNEFAKVRGIKYSPVAESCPRLGVQTKTLDISRRGLCNLWALLFIEIFLINKEMTLQQVQALFDKLSPKQLANVVFNYFWSVKSESLEGSGLPAKKVQYFTSASYKKNKDLKGIGKYRLDNSLSTSQAKVFVNKDTGKVVVANRGTTHTLKDWTNNLSLLLGQYKNTARYKNARDIQKKVLEKYPEFKVLNVGHSQGAAITKRLNEEGLTSEIININPAALPTDRKKDNETTIRSSGDIVSMYDRPKKGDIMLKAKSLNPFQEHRTNIVGELPPKTYIGKGFHSKFEWFD